MRDDRVKGFFVAFDYSANAMSEIGAFFRRTGKSILALTVREKLNDADYASAGVNLESKGKSTDRRPL